jgi:hypothetical protein
MNPKISFKLKYSDIYKITLTIMIPQKTLEVMTYTHLHARNVLCAIVPLMNFFGGYAKNPNITFN